MKEARDIKHADNEGAGVMDIQNQSCQWQGDTWRAAEEEGKTARNARSYLSRAVVRILNAAFAVPEFTRVMILITDCFDADGSTRSRLRCKGSTSMITSELGPGLETAHFCGGPLTDPQSLASSTSFLLDAHEASFLSLNSVLSPSSSHSHSPFSLLFALPLACPLPAMLGFDS